MWLTKNPEEYGVIVASNLFGAVISDAFAGLVGGLGFAASGHLGREDAVFDATHGLLWRINSRLRPRDRELIWRNGCAYFDRRRRRITFCDRCARRGGAM